MYNKHNKRILEKININSFVKKSFFIILPPLPNGVIADKSTLAFDNFPHYWNSFYSSSLKYIPDEQKIIIRYEDILFNTEKVIDDLKIHLNVKKNFTQSSFQPILNEIFEQPAKSSGNSRFGSQAKAYYNPNNIF